MLTTDRTRPDVSALDARLTGSAYAPADAGYDEARVGFILGLDSRAAVVAQPETAADVVAIVDFARAHGLRIAPQGTGHNAHPLGSLEDASLLRTNRMRGVEIDPERRVARAEAGAWMLDVVEPAAAHGLSPLLGSSPDVGVVGYNLGGGVSWMARKHGMSTNHVVAVEVVTPDGRLVRADHVNEPDLFWALRGGGGNFGVVTAIEMRLAELETAYAGAMFFGVERAEEVLKAWVAWTRDAPEEVTSFGSILNVPPMPEIPEMLRGQSFERIAEIAGAGSSSPLVMVELRHMGGALRRREPGQGVTGTLPGEFMAFSVGIPMTPEMGAAIHTDLGILRDALGSYDTRRTYLNFVEREVDAAQFYDETSYARLRAIKAAVDPDELIRANHPIPPA